MIHRHRYEFSVEITPPESIYPNFRYHAIDLSDAVENEMYPVFTACTTSTLRINDDEVMNYQWYDLAVVLCGIGTAPQASNPWMTIQATDRRARKRLSAFTQFK